MTDVGNKKLSEYTAMQYVVLTYPNSILVNPEEEQEISLTPTKDGYDLNMSSGGKIENISIIAHNNDGQGKSVEVLKKNGLHTEEKTCYKIVLVEGEAYYLERSTYDKSEQMIFQEYYTWPPKLDMFRLEKTMGQSQTLSKFVPVNSTGEQKTKTKATP